MRWRAPVVASSLVFWKVPLQQLSAEMRDILKQCGDIGDDLQVSAFAVGGFVRDLLLRQKNLDLDIVVEGDGIAFARRRAILPL